MPESPVRGNHLTRRRFLQALGGGAAAGIGVVGYTFLVEPHWLRVIRRPLPIRALPPSLEGKLLLQISDLHIGARVDSKYLVRALQLARSLSPDIVVLTGDTADDASPRWHREAARILSHLPLAPIGTFAIMGNHDYGPGWRHPEMADDVTDLLTDAGATVLRNARADVQGLQVLGMDDFWTERFDGAGTMALLDPARPALVLCHNPDVCDLDIWGDYQGWILCGHTHGGQCKPPFLPPPLLPVRNRRYTRGEFSLPGGRNLHISAGVGYLRKVRFNVRPDVVLFTLQAQSA